MMDKKKESIAIVGYGDLRSPIELDLHEVGLHIIECSCSDLHELCADKQVCAVLLFDVADKAYWVHRILAFGLPILCTHPLSSRHEDIQTLLREDVEHNVYILSERVKMPPSLTDITCDTGPLLFFEVRVSTPEARLKQALLETFDLINAHLFPVDEIFARTRNAKGLSADPDIVLAHLRMRNGLEGLVEILSLGGRDSATIHFYGRSGERVLDGEDATRLLLPQIKAISKREWSSREMLPLESAAKSYQMLHWLEKAGRFDRVINYRESRRLS